MHQAVEETAQAMDSDWCVLLRGSKWKCTDITTADADFVVRPSLPL